MQSPDASLQQSTPHIQVVITPDAMAARLIVEPRSSERCSLDQTMILNTLSEHRIVSGIHTEAIDKLVNDWATEIKRYEITTVASGTPAQPAREGSFSMTVRHLSNRSSCDKVKNSRWFWEVAHELPSIDHVVTGQIIAEKKTADFPTPGENIHGEPVFTDEIVPSTFTIESGAKAGPDQTTITATIDGIAYRIEDAIGVLPINFNGTFTIEVSQDAMTVLCTAHPPGPEGSFPPQDEIYRLLTENGVTHGIQKKDIATLFALCNRGAFPTAPFVVARGTLPVNGDDGKLQYYFDTNTSLTPKIDDNGHADYKSVDIVITAHAYQKLVSLVPPTSGSEGTDVRGRILPAEPGKPTKLPQGAHTMVDPSDPSMLCAETDGIIRCAGGVVEICEGFVVPGDVDFSTGNIEYNKTVIVNGDVKSGFGIHCGGDLQVSGTIEDCSVNVGGSVLCKYGFVGQGKGVIEAKGDVNLGFMKNQCVKTFKNINIAKEALNCTLLSRGAVSVHGNPLSVAGGEIKARSSIIVHTAGNHTGIRTLLEAGIDYLMAEELKMLEEQLKTIGKNSRSTADAYSKFKKSIAGKRRLTTFEQRKNNDFTNSLKQISRQLGVIEERKAIVEGKVYQLPKAFIRIEHTAFPGTLIKLGYRHFLLKEELTGPKTIRLIDNDILIS